MLETPIILPTDDNTLVFASAGSGKSYSVSKWVQNQDVIVRQFNFLPYLDKLSKHRTKYKSWHYIFNEWFLAQDAKPHIVVVDNVDAVFRTHYLIDAFNSLMHYWRSHGHEHFNANMVVLARPENREYFKFRLRFAIQFQKPRDFRFLDEIVGGYGMLTRREFIDRQFKNSQIYSAKRFEKFFLDSTQTLNLRLAARTIEMFRTQSGPFPTRHNYYEELRDLCYTELLQSHGPALMAVLAFIANNLHEFAHTGLIKRTTIYDKLRKYRRTIDPKWMQSLDFMGLRTKQQFLNLLTKAGAARGVIDNKLKWSSTWLVAINTGAKKLKRSPANV